MLVLLVQQTSPGTQGYLMNFGHPTGLTPAPKIQPSVRDPPDCNRYMYAVAGIVSPSLLTVTAAAGPFVCVHNHPCVRGCNSQLEDVLRGGHAHEAVLDTDRIAQAAVLLASDWQHLHLCAGGHEGQAVEVCAGQVEQPEGNVAAGVIIRSTGAGISGNGSTCRMCKKRGVHQGEAVL